MPATTIQVPTRYVLRDDPQSVTLTGTLTEIVSWLAREWGDWPGLLDVVDLLEHGLTHPAGVLLAPIGITIRKESAA